MTFINIQLKTVHKKHLLTTVMEEESNLNVWMVVFLANTSVMVRKTAMEEKMKKTAFNIQSYLKRRMDSRYPANNYYYYYSYYY